MHRLLPRVLATILLLIIALWAYRQFYLVPTLRDIVTRDMRDPEGARFRHDALLTVGLVRHSQYCGEVNVTNAAGGYVGYQPFVAFGMTGNAYIGSDVQETCDKVRHHGRWLGLGMLVDLVTHDRTATAEADFKHIPDGAVGVKQVDADTEFVFLAQGSEIGGACEGWSAVSVRALGQPGSASTDLICWREHDDLLQTATRTEVHATSLTMSDIR